MAGFDIGIVIVSYNVRHFLEQCLHSIGKSSTSGLNIEVWVVDNASVDGTVQYIADRFPDVNIISNTENVGFSRANNQAINRMQSKYVLLLNPDTVLEETTLQLCYDFMEAKPQTGAVGVRMIDGSGKFLPESKRKIPDIWNSFCKLSYLSDLFPSSKVFSGYNLGYLPEDQTAQVEVLCGAFMFIRAEALKMTGLLDEQFFMYGEDIDLSYRILKAGYEIWYYPQSSIIHYKGESTKKSSLSYVKTFYGAMHIYVNKHYGKGKGRIFAWIINAAITMRAMVSAAGRVLAFLIFPMIDAVLIWFSLLAMKSFWAEWYFKDTSYYDEGNIHSILPIYAGIWVLSLWIGGHYDKTSSWRHSFTSFLVGTVFILMGYALLPESMRSSRAIILLGAIAGMVVVSLTSLLRAWLRNDHNNSSGNQSIAVVGSRQNAEKLALIVHKLKPESEIYNIAPGSSTGDVWFTNSLNHLPEVVKKLKIGEVIFSSEDVQMKEIIRAMTAIGPSVKYRIGGDDSLSMIGSASKHHQGELVSLDVSYKLSEPANRRFKRLLDLCMSALFIPLSPALFILAGLKLRLFSNIGKVFMGNATWVGYGGDNNDFDFLPEIPAAIIKYPLTGRVINYNDNYFKHLNTEYARHYSWYRDLKIILTHFHKLSNNTFRNK